MITEQRKIYNQANKDKTKEYNKQWRLANSEYDKQWYQDNNNKEKYIDNHKQWLLNNKLPYTIVYLLPDHNYVGITDNPANRMYNHKCHHNRNIANMVELARYTDREEALAHEARLHNTGYEGGKVCYNITQEA